MTLREGVHVEGVYRSARDIHKGEQFAVLVSTVANETPLAEFHSSRSSPAGLLPGGWLAWRHPSWLSRVAVKAGLTWHILQRHTVL